MAHAGHIIAKRERPAADALEPIVDTPDLLLVNADLPSIPFDKIKAHGAPEQIAERDAAGSAEECCEYGRYQMQLVAKNQNANESQQEFIGHGKAYDAKHQQGENSHIGVLHDPLQNEMPNHF